METLANFPAFVADFVRTFGQLQLIEAVVIALFFGIAAETVIGVVFLPVAASIVFLAADVVLTALTSHLPIDVPSFDAALLEKGIALYVLFLVSMAIVFGVKKAVLGLRK
jgi:hypothetical protein